MNSILDFAESGLFSTLETLYHKRNITILSLLYRYLHGKYSYQLHAIVLVVKTFTAPSRYFHGVESTPFLPKFKKKALLRPLLPQRTAPL